MQLPPGLGAAKQELLSLSDAGVQCESLLSQVKQNYAQRYRLAAAAAADGAGASDGDRLYQQMVSDPSCESLLLMLHWQVGLLCNELVAKAHSSFLARWLGCTSALTGFLGRQA